MTTPTNDPAVHQIGPERQRHWDPQPGDAQLIAKHLLRQADLPADRVRLDDGQVVLVGADAVGEGDDNDCDR